MQAGAPAIPDCGLDLDPVAREALVMPSGKFIVLVAVISLVTNVAFERYQAKRG